MYGVVIGLTIPQKTFFYCIPLLNCTVKGYARKMIAILEHSLADTRYAIAYGYACKIVAICERRITNTCYTVGYSYTRKTATAERRITDTRYAVGYSYACHIV